MVVCVSYCRLLLGTTKLGSDSSVQYVLVAPQASTFLWTSWIHLVLFFAGYALPNGQHDSSQHHRSARP